MCAYWIMSELNQPLFRFTNAADVCTVLHGGPHLIVNWIEVWGMVWYSRV